MQTTFGLVSRTWGCLARVTCCQANDSACDTQRLQASGSHRPACDQGTQTLPVNPRQRIVIFLSGEGVTVVVSAPPQPVPTSPVFVRG